MANAPTKTKLHDQLESIILNTRRLIDEKLEAKAITKTRADQLRSEMQKKMAAALVELDEQIVEELLSGETIKPAVTNDLEMPEDEYQDLLRHGVLHYEEN
jgi:hypothetical protein